MHFFETITHQSSNLSKSLLLKTALSVYGGSNDQGKFAFVQLWNHPNSSEYFVNLMFARISQPIITISFNSITFVESNNNTTESTAGFRLTEHECYLAPINISVVDSDMLYTELLVYGWRTTEEKSSTEFVLHSQVCVKLTLSIRSLHVSRTFQSSYLIGNEKLWKKFLLLKVDFFNKFLANGAWQKRLDCHRASNWGFLG